MVTINKFHHLSSLELSLLQSLIGKTLVSIDAPRHLDNLDDPLFNCVEEVYLSFKDCQGYVKFTAGFEETDFGDDFMTFQITEASSMETVEQLGEPLLGLNYTMPHEFVICKIEVYGESYEVYSKNNHENPVWDIEIKHPHQPIYQKVENENVFLFYSNNEKLLVRAFNAFKIIEFTSNERFIQSSLYEQNLAGDIITKLKQTIS